ncbi:MAG: SHOCT domain-containing protein [Proteobacteria bacterium]|nr:SHOCT domain-containing protein [Pseudomonadota bacterium]
MGIIIIIAIIVVLFLLIFNRGYLFKMENTDSEKAKDIIKKRYAKGEITKEEYDEMMEKLEEYG